MDRGMSRDIVSNIKEFSKDVTVSFSGYNIKDIALLSIKSFIKNYSRSKAKIVYFDDCSTDGTAEELEKLNVKVITWRNKDYINYLESDRYTELENYGTKVTIRCGLINNEIMEQCDTKYLYINDGDLVHHKRGSFETHFRNISNGNIHSIPCYSNDDVFLYCDDKEYIEYLEEINRLGSGLGKIYDINSELEEIKFLRFYLNNAIIDVEYLKERGIQLEKFDTGPDERLGHGGLDTGSHLMNSVLKDGGERLVILTLELNMVELDKTTLHLNWVSSFVRNKENETDENLELTRCRIEFSKRILNYELLNKICDDIGVDISDILKYYI